MHFRNSAIETSSPTSPVSPGAVIGVGFLGYLTAFLLGCACIFFVGVFVFVHQDSPADSRSLRLPDSFVLSAKHTSLFDRPSLWVEDTEGGAWGMVVQARDAAPLTELNYEQNNGVLLMSTKLSATKGFHHFQVLSWDHEKVAYVHIEDAGARHVSITDPSGKVLAEGEQDAITHAFVLRLPEGLKVATIADDQKTDEWSVTIANPSRVPPAVYAFVAAYEMFEKKAASVAH